MYFAGAFALVPWTFKSVAAVEEWIGFLRGIDADHEVGHAQLHVALLNQYGWCDELIRLFAFRTVEHASEMDLAYAGLKYGLPELESFLDTGLALSRRKTEKEHRSIYVAAGGKRLFEPTGDQTMYETWLELAEGRGMKFDETDRDFRSSKDYWAPLLDGVSKEANPEEAFKAFWSSWLQDFDPNEFLPE